MEAAAAAAAAACCFTRLLGFLVHDGSEKKYIIGGRCTRLGRPREGGGSPAFEDPGVQQSDDGRRLELWKEQAGEGEEREERPADASKEERRRRDGEKEKPKRQGGGGTKRTGFRVDPKPVIQVTHEARETKPGGVPAVPPKRSRGHRAGKTRKSRPLPRAEKGAPNPINARPPQGGHAHTPGLTMGGLILTLLYKIYV